MLPKDVTDGNQSRVFCLSRSVIFKKIIPKAAFAVEDRICVVLGKDHLFRRTQAFLFRWNLFCCAGYSRKCVHLSRAKQLLTLLLSVSQVIRLSGKVYHGGLLELCTEKGVVSRSDVHASHLLRCSHSDYVKAFRLRLDVSY